MKYVGVCDGHFHWNVYVEKENGTRHPLHHFIRHSPDGFAWGYGGSGPAELARCILADFLHLTPTKRGDLIRIDGFYQTFKVDFIAKFPKDKGWELEGVIIQEWINDQERRAKLLKGDI